jgi:RimJ/RimL family protein N-acetyltransferase
MSSGVVSGSDGRFALRPWCEDDADWYLAVRDDEIFRWTTEVRDVERAGFLERLAGLDGKAVAGYALLQSGDPIGNVSAMRRDDVAELSYWVVAGARGRGAASAGLEMLSDWVERTWDVRRLELLIHPDNTGSINVATKSGYVADGMRETGASCAGPDGMVAVFARVVHSD